MRCCSKSRILVRLAEFGDEQSLEVEAPLLVRTRPSKQRFLPGPESLQAAAGPAASVNGFVTAQARRVSACGLGPTWLAGT